MTIRTYIAVPLLLLGCPAPDDDPTATAGETESGASSGSTGAMQSDSSPTDSGPEPNETDSAPDSTSSSTGGPGDDGSSSEGGSDDTGGPSGPFDPACPPPNLDDLPGWVPGPGTWGTISTNTMWDVNPCEDDPNCAWSGNLGQSAVLDVWNGGAFACHEGELGSLIAWGGGHHGYWGNEVYVYDLASQVWERRSDPNPNVMVTDPANGELDDGTPSVMHTYEMLAYDRTSNSLVVLQGQSVHNNASSNGAGHMFSLTDDAWRRTAYLGSVSGYGNSAYDASRAVIWASSQFGDFFEYDPAGGPDAEGRYGTATVHHPVGIGLDSVGAIDPNNDVYVLGDFRSDPPRLLVQDLSDPASAMVEVAVEGPMPTQGAGGFEWASSRQRFYWIADGGTELRTLEPPDDVDDGGLQGDWQSDAWRWETVTPLAGQGPPARGNGVYGGFRWAPAIQSFVVCNDVQEPVYAFRP